MEQPLRVLFVDDHNASRTRMAEAILRVHGGDDFRVASAGVDPLPIDPYTRQLLEQLNMDLGDERSAPIADYAGEHFDFVIVLRDEQAGEPESSFTAPGDTVTWDVPDPTAIDEDGEARAQSYRRIFELLRQRIQVFILAQHDELRERGSDNVVGAHQPTDDPA